MAKTEVEFYHTKQGFGEGDRIYYHARGYVKVFDGIPFGFYKETNPTNWIAVHIPSGLSPYKEDDPRWKRCATLGAAVDAVLANLPKIKKALDSDKVKRETEDLACYVKRLERRVECV